MSYRALSCVPVIRRPGQYTSVTNGAKNTIQLRQRQDIRTLARSSVRYSGTATKVEIRSRRNNTAAGSPLQIRSTSYYSTPAKMPKLAPSDPESVMVIRKVCDDIITCSLPFARVGLFKFGGRATIVRLQTGAIAVFSPVALTPSVSEAVTSLNGTVKYLIAPDMEHHLFLADWTKAYPDAVIIAPEGLWEKRQKNPTTSGPKFEHIYTAQNKETLHISDEFAADFDVEYIHAHVNREIVLLHKPTATLIQADLFFNPPGYEQYRKAQEGPLSGLANKLYLSLMSAKGSAMAQWRVIWYLMSAGGREAFKQSIQKIDGWEFDRAIPCHGDTINQGAKHLFRTLFEWFLV